MIIEKQGKRYRLVIVNDRGFRMQLVNYVYKTVKGAIRGVKDAQKYFRVPFNGEIKEV